MPYEIEEIEQRFKDEDGLMYGSAYRWMIAKIKLLEKENKIQSKQIIALEWREADACKLAMAQLVDIAASTIGSPTEDDLQKYIDRVRTQFNLPKAV